MLETAGKQEPPLSVRQGVYENFRFLLRALICGIVAPKCGCASETAQRVVLICALTAE